MQPRSNKAFELSLGCLYYCLLSLLCFAPQPAMSASPLWSACLPQPQWLTSGLLQTLLGADAAAASEARRTLIAQLQASQHEFLEREGDGEWRTNQQRTSADERFVCVLFV